MSKRSIESRIVTYFETAPLPTAQLVLGLISAKVRDRVKASEGQVTKPVARRKRRTKLELAQDKVKTGLAKAVSFEPENFATVGQKQ